MSEHLLKDNVLNRVRNKIKAKPGILLFLDYDGTLSPFHDNPDEAVPLPGIKVLLRQLSQRDDLILTIISGRPISGIKQFLELDKLYYAGLHGREILTPGGNKIYPGRNSEQSNIDELKEILKSYYNQEGYYLEDKGTVLTLHHLANLDQDNIARYLEARINLEKYEIMKGRQIIEIRPKGWDKGKAVMLIQDLIHEKSDRDFQVIYIGDDRTDEDAFAVLGQGISVYVQNEDNLKTYADYYLKDPGEVKKFLQIMKSLH